MHVLRPGRTIDHNSHMVLTRAGHTRIRENKSRALWNVVLFPFHLFTRMRCERYVRTDGHVNGKKYQQSIPLSAEVSYVWMQTIRCTASHHWMPSHRRLYADAKREMSLEENGTVRFVANNICYLAINVWVRGLRDRHAAAMFKQIVHMCWDWPLRTIYTHKCILFTVFNSERRLVHSDIRFILIHVSTVFYASDWSRSCILHHFINNTMDVTYVRPYLHIHVALRTCSQFAQYKLVVQVQTKKIICDNNSLAVVQSGRANGLKWTETE